MLERVSIREGDAETTPVLLIAPHGYDDPLTGLITEKIAEALDAFMVINNGWQRGENYDYDQSKANCNNIAHCHEDVVKEEFLDPIMQYVDTICERHAMGEAHIFIMHGVSNIVNSNRKSNVDVIVGFGDGNPSSYSCDLEKKNAFCYILSTKLNTYVGGSGGQFSGRRRKNLNQLYRKWYQSQNAHSMQIEIVRDLRDTPEIAGYTAELLGNCIDDYIDFLQAEELPKGFQVNWQAIAQKLPII
jgi:hypothetical protein